MIKPPSLKLPKTIVNKSNREELNTSIYSQFKYSLNLGIMAVLWPYNSTACDEFTPKRLTSKKKNRNKPSLRQILIILKIKLNYLNLLILCIPDTLYSRLVALVIHQLNYWLRVFDEPEQQDQIVVMVNQWFIHKETPDVIDREFELIKLANKFTPTKCKMLNSMITGWLSIYNTEEICFNWQQECETFFDFSDEEKEQLTWDHFIFDFEGFEQFILKHKECNEKVLKTFSQLITYNRFLSFETNNTSQEMQLLISMLILFKLAGLDYLKSNEINLETLVTCENGLNQQLECLYETTKVVEIKTRMANDLNLELADVDMLLWDKLFNHLDRFLAQWYFA